MDFSCLNHEGFLMQDFCLDHERRMLTLQREFDKCRQKYEGAAHAVKVLRDEFDSLHNTMLSFELLTRPQEEIVRLHHDYHGAKSKMMAMVDFGNNCRDELVKLSKVMNEEKAKFDKGYKEWIQRLLVNEL